MRMQKIVWPFVALSVGLAPAPALAKTSAAEAAKLGQSLTPIGAEKAANKEGTIPEWTGGMSTLGPMFKDYKAGDYYPDPFPDDKPLFSITAENVDRFRDRLSAGQVEMLHHVRVLWHREGGGCRKRRDDESAADSE